MFSQNQEEIKLEWMYKGPHSTVDREEYLLGRSVDKTLDQINTEENQQLGITQAKNHVEHECIPPSIRAYKQQCGEQVDINTKLQEDPLVAIKRQEDEKRRQFLNNPVQIKKLQRALKAQKKTQQRCIDSDKELDAKLVDKLRSLKNDSLIPHTKSKQLKDANLDTILMHKYNQLKSKLSDNDLRDIFEGKADSSSTSSNSSSSEDEDKPKGLKKGKNNKDSDKRIGYEKPKKIEYKLQKRKSESTGREGCNSKRSTYDGKVGDKNKTQQQKLSGGKSRSYDNRYEHKNAKYKSNERHRSRSYENNGVSRVTYEKQGSHNSKKQKHDRSRSRSYDDKYENRKTKYEFNDKHIRLSEKYQHKDTSRHEEHGSYKNKKQNRSRSRSRSYDNIYESKKSKYESTKKHRSRSRSYERKCIDKKNVKQDFYIKHKQTIPYSIKKHRSSSESNSSSSSSSDSEKSKKKHWGLVKADGTKIPLSVQHTSNRSAYIKPTTSVQVKSLENRSRQQLTEEEKEKRRREMLANASWREIERSKNLEIHRKKLQKEDEETKVYNTKFLQKELLKSASSGSVESRIKANINNIQRSGTDMNKHFSRR